MDYKLYWKCKLIKKWYWKKLHLQHILVLDFLFYVKVLLWQNFCSHKLEWFETNINIHYFILYVCFMCKKHNFSQLHTICIDKYLSHAYIYKSDK